MPSSLVLVQRAMAATFAGLTYRDAPGELIFQDTFVHYGPMEERLLQRVISAAPSVSIGLLGYDQWPEGGVPMASAEFLITVCANDIARPAGTDPLRNRFSIATDMAAAIDVAMFDDCSWGVDLGSHSIVHPSKVRWQHLSDDALSNSVSLLGGIFTQDVEIFQAELSDYSEFDTLRVTFVPEASTGAETPNVEREIDYS